MRRKIISRSFSGLLLVVIGVTGCATVRIPIQVTHPAEINMTPYKQVAITEIKGDMGQAFSDSIKSNLVESNRFQVVDRDRLDHILRELNFSQSDLADETKRVKLGKLLSASAMIAGHTEGKYDEQLTHSGATCGLKDKQYPCTVYTREGVVKTSGSIDVINIQTGQIIKSKTLNNSCSTRTQATDATPIEIDRDSLFRTCLSQNVHTFLKAISPWIETVQVPFVKDSAIPDLEKGINRAQMGEMSEAIKIFAGAAKAAETSPGIKPTSTTDNTYFDKLKGLAGLAASDIKPESIANAYWNLGLAYEYTWEFDKAIEAFKKAGSLHADEKYPKERANAERLKTEQQKLKEHGKGT